MKRLAWVLAVLLMGALQSSCGKEGCLGDEPKCRVPPPCPKVQFRCDAALGGQLSVAPVSSTAMRPGGWNGLATIGDVKLSNAFADVVIAGIGNQNYLDPNGGSILDLSPAGKPKDTVNNILQAVGLLPTESARYTSLEIIDERPARVAVQVRGTLDGRPDLKISTRYELQPCDQGVRVRTEIANGGVSSELWALVDGYYWSGRESLPFAPGSITVKDTTYSGFSNPSFGLTTVNDVFRLMPYMAAAGHSSDQQVSAISTSSCTDSTLEGFHSDQISAAGLRRRVVPPRGFLIFERFIAVADTQGVSGAVDLALEVRRQVLDERVVTVRGRVERMGTGSFDSERKASVLISEGTLSTPQPKRIQWTQVVPKADGSFAANVPVGKSYVVEVHTLGRSVVERDHAAVSADADLGTFVLPPTVGQVGFTVHDDLGSPLNAEIFVVPVDDEERARVLGSLHGRFTQCSPWLGPPPGASPACNRILVRSGVGASEIPAGRYHFYAFHGPFWSLARETRVISDAPATLSFTLRRLALQPSGTVGADLHVHGAASFDSSLPDLDRVLSFAASDLEIIVGTDHDVVHDYSGIIEQLGLRDRMTAVTGVETTGHIPFMYIPNYAFPLVIGHYNLWPIRYDPSLPRNGGPFDELIEPGELFERAKTLFTNRVPLIELNHPWADPEFGRDLGYPRALALDMRRDLPDHDDGTSAGMYVRTPKNSTFANDGHHAQEVMNGSDNSSFLQYRAVWHWMLNQGRLKTGTANSDSHSLTDNTVGVPRNLVVAPTRPGPSFNIDAFNQAVRDGKVLGTNGPVIAAALEDVDGVPRTFSLTPFRPRPTAAIRVTVSSAPWVPVEEVRFVVNGRVAKTIGPLPVPADPFAFSGSLVRWEGEVLLSELLAGISGDAWVVVEAGRSLPRFADLGGGLNGALDGVPDTTDNNGDGQVDSADVASGQKIGPLKDHPAPKSGEPGFDYFNLMLGHPTAFTNPFVLDRDGDGRFTRPGANGGR